jgi:hypothetical protein
MFTTARRPIGALALLLLLAPAMAGCLSTQRIPFDDAVGLDGVIGVMTHSGREIPFAKRGALIRNDTVYAIGRSGQVTLPTDSIAQVIQQKASPRRSTLLMVGLVAAVAGSIAFSSSFSTPLGAH